MSAPIKRSALALLAASVLLPAPARAQLAPLPWPWDQGGAGLGLALRRLPVTSRVLYVTAHPDDENNAVLVALARGRGVATALLTLTRGEGGQNAIGSERGEALGVLRTEELRAVHRYDGARQFFGAAYEFGFSFSLEETLARWGEEETLGDVVRVVRAFRPDVILTLPLDAPDHQHHVAAARLAALAFRAAADPARLPEQVREGLRPWQPRAIYAGGVGGGNELPAGVTPTVLRTGDHDPLLGMTWAELGSLARTMHKCQAARQLKIAPGEFASARFVLVDAEPKLAAPPADILDVVDGSLAGLLRFVPGPGAGWLAAGLGALETEIRYAQAAYDARAPERTLGPLATGLLGARDLGARLRESGLPEDARREILDRLEAKEQDFLAALALAQGLTLEATADDDDVVPGQTFGVTARVFNPGPATLRVADVALRVAEGWAVERVSGAPAMLGANEALTLNFRVTVAQPARVTQPYWRREGARDRYASEIPADRSLPWSPPDVVARLEFVVADVPATLERPVVFRYPGRWVGGEKQKTVNVVPALALRVTPDLAVFPVTGRGRLRREFRVTVRNNAKGPSAATLRLELPPGWVAEPRESPLRLGAEGNEAVVRFVVTPPTGLREGEHTIGAVAARDGGRAFREGYQTVAYDHIEERHLLRRAAARALVLDVRTLPGASIGYVMGVGDEVPEAITQLGLPVTLLSPDDLAQGDLSRYSTIVLGVRAYQARNDLGAYHARLLRYVEGGGNLLVQYQRGEFNPTPDAPSPYAPYPARVTTRRVTDETAPLEVLVPASPVFLSPNRLGPGDWDGWVQERGIQLLEAKDPHYLELLSSADPFPRNPGPQKGLLVEARLGKGTWTYVGLVLFRELPAGVPGAYRLLANLLSRPRGR